MTQSALPGRAMIRPLIRTLVFGAAVASLGGCVTDGGDPFAAFTSKPGPALAPAPLPRYAVGDAFTFDDGRTETVVAVKGERIDWKNNYGFAFSEYANPVMPRIAWESRTRESRLDLLTAPPASLWPLKVGNSVKFDYANTVTDKKTGEKKEYGQYWTCTVTGTETVTVPAGTFDTYRIRCYRHSRTYRSYGERAWYFAPGLGHYVKKTDTYYSARDSQTRQLTSASLSLAAAPEPVRAAFDQTVQKGLGTLKSGGTLTWESPDRNYALAVTPLRTFKTKKGFFCREYLETRSLGNRSGPARETACRMDDGVWKIL